MDDTTRCYPRSTTNPPIIQKNMMTSSNGIIFRVTGPLCGEFTGLGEFPTQRPVTRSFDVFFDLRLNKRLCTFLVQIDALWDMRLVHCGICANGLYTPHCLPSHTKTQSCEPFMPSLLLARTSHLTNNWVAVDLTTCIFVRVECIVRVRKFYV